MIGKKKRDSKCRQQVATQTLLLALDLQSAVIVVEHPDFNGDGQFALLSNRRHHVVNELPFVLQPRAITATTRDALRAAQVKVHSITLERDFLHDFYQHLGVVTGKLTQHRVVAFACRPCLTILDMRYELLTCIKLRVLNDLV